MESKMRCEVLVKDCQVILQFSENITWIAFDKPSAKKLAKMLLEYADEITEH